MRPLLLIKEKGEREKFTGADLSCSISDVTRSKAAFCPDFRILANVLLVCVFFPFAQFPGFLRPDQQLGRSVMDCCPSARLEAWH